MTINGRSLDQPGAGHPLRPRPDIVLRNPTTLFWNARAGLRTNLPAAGMVPYYRRALSRLRGRAPPQRSLGSRRRSGCILQPNHERGHVQHAFLKTPCGPFLRIYNCCSCCCGAMQAWRNGGHAVLLAMSARWIQTTAAVAAPAPNLASLRPSRCRWQGRVDTSPVWAAAYAPQMPHEAWFCARAGRGERWKSRLC